MALEATAIFDNHPGEHRLSVAQSKALCNTPKIITNVEDSKNLIKEKGL